MNSDAPTPEDDESSPIPTRVFILIFLALAFITYHFIFGDHRKNRTHRGQNEDPIWVKQAKELKPPLPDRLKSPTPVSPHQQQIESILKARQAE